MADVYNDQEIVNDHADQEFIGDFAPSKLSTELRRELNAYNRRLLREFTGIETLPLRPRKWTTAYHFFIQDFHRTKRQNNSEMTNREIIRAAYPAWMDLPTVEKEYYRRESAADKDSYNHKMEQWHRYKRELQPVPSSFALFVKHILETSPEERSKREVRSFCTTQWTVMTPLEKEHYFRQRELMNLRRWHLIDRLRRGADIEHLFREIDGDSPIGVPEVEPPEDEDDFENPDSVDNNNNNNSENNEHDSQSVDWAWDGPADYLEDIESSEDEDEFTV